MSLESQWLSSLEKFNMIDALIFLQIYGAMFMLSVFHSMEMNLGQKIRVLFLGHLPIIIMISLYFKGQI